MRSLCPTAARSAALPRGRDRRRRTAAARIVPHIVLICTAFLSHLFLLGKKTGGVRRDIDLVAFNKIPRDGSRMVLLPVEEAALSGIDLRASVRIQRLERVVEDTPYLEMVQKVWQSAEMVGVVVQAATEPFAAATAAAPARNSRLPNIGELADLFVL